MIPIVIGIAITVIGSFAKEFGTPLPFPSEWVGGGIAGIGIGLLMVSRSAAKKEGPRSN